MEIKKSEDKDLEKARHSLAHILAKALLQLYPDTKLTIGPAIEDGFYYDIDLAHSITPDEYDKIEKKMKEIINKGEEFSKKVLSKKEALELFKDNPYKIELIQDLPENEEISILPVMIFLIYVEVLMLQVLKIFKIMDLKFIVLMVLIGEEMKKIKCFNVCMYGHLKQKKNSQIILHF